MRRLSRVVLVTTALGLAVGPLLAVPAAVGAGSVTWRPEAAPDGTGFWSNACTTDAHTNAHSALTDDDSSLAGNRTFVNGADSGATDIAWRYDPAGHSVEGGPVVTLTAPASVTSFAVRARSTSGGLSGRLLAYYKAPGSKSGDYYVGEAAISTAGGSWQTLDASGTMLWNRHRTPGLLTPEWTPVYASGLLGGGTNEPKSLSGFAKDHATDGSMLVSYQLGCSGEPFDIDHITVTGSGGTTDYDLTNQSSTSTLSSSADKVSAGGKVTLTGKVVGAFSDATPAGGTTSLQAKKYGATTWTTDPTTPSGGRYTVAPTGTTSYRLHYGGSDAAAASTSSAVTVQVVTRVSATLAPGSITKGKKVTLSGKVNPATSGVPVSLQRKDGNTWKTLATTHSTTGGSYKVSATAHNVGAWTVRAYAGSAHGNLAGGSSAHAFTVRTLTTVSLGLSSSSVLTGHKYTVKGTARPHKKGVKVTLQRRVGGKWVKMATTHTSAKGTYKFTRTAGGASVVPLRVVVAGWGLNSTGVSRTRTLTVHAPAPPPPPSGGGDGGGTGIGSGGDGGGTGIG